MNSRWSVDIRRNAVELVNFRLEQTVQRRVIAICIVEVRPQAILSALMIDFDFGILSA